MYILPQRPHHIAQLLLRDAAVAVLVEQTESLAKVAHLVLGDDSPLLTGRRTKVKVIIRTGRGTLRAIWRVHHTVPRMLLVL